MYSKEEKLEMYRYLVLMRKYNDAIQASVAKAEIYGLHHLGTGEECIEVAASCAAQDKDWITGENRWRAHWIKRKGLKLYSAEEFGKENTTYRGICAEYHVAYPEVNCMYNNTLMGSNAAIGSGLAYGLKMDGNRAVHIVAIGDGSFNEGVVYEALELAYQLALPVVYIIHDNGWGWSYRVNRNFGNIAKRADAFGIPSVDVDGNDMLAVREVVDRAIESARDNKPMLVHCITHRWLGHMLGCDPTLYEPPGESLHYRKTDDCLKRYRDVLLYDGTLIAELIAEIDAEVAAEITACWRDNIKAEYPGRDVVLDKTKVYAQPWEGNEE
jgi:TPP-dependent pyruvate/acetoin dehydrogenase alpha subunit